MIYVLAPLKANPGRAGDILAAATCLIEETRKEKGCLSYDLFRKTDDDDMLIFVETWESREDLEAHFSAPHIKAFGTAIAGLVAEGRIEVIHPARTEIV